MKRRHYLVTAAAVAIAGCSSSEPDDTGEPETEAAGATEDDGPEDEDGDEEAEETPAEEQSETDDVETEEESGPTDEDLAAEHIDDAQAALNRAVEEFNAEAHPYEEFGTGLDASTEEISTASIEGYISDLRRETADAKEYDISDEQRDTVNALERSANFVELVIETHPDLHELYAEVEYLLQEMHDWNLSQVRLTIETIRRGVGHLEDDIDDVSQAADIAEAQETELVEAVDWDGIDSQRSVMVSDFEAIDEVVDGIELLSEADALFQPARDEYLEDWDDGDRDAFEDAEALYESATGISGSDSPSFADTVESITCYGEHMADASDDYVWAISQRGANNPSRAEDREDSAEENIDDANDCW